MLVIVRQVWAERPCLSGSTSRLPRGLCPRLSRALRAGHYSVKSLAVPLEYVARPHLGLGKHSAHFLVDDLLRRLGIGSGLG